MSSLSLSIAPTPFCYFNSLPIELHRLILVFLPDFYSLRSTVIASRSAHAAYVHSSHAVQRIILERLLSLSPQLSTESRWLLAASYLRRNTKDWRDHMDLFLAYGRPKLDGGHSSSHLNITSAQGLQFHLDVEYFTATFLRAADLRRQKRDQPTAKREAANIGLEDSERVRIQRALYRFQRVCQMYPRTTPPVHPRAPTWGEHPLGDFVRELPSWELEELRSIYRYLMLTVAFLDRSDYAAALGAPSPQATLSACRYREHVVSMGLIFLHELLDASFNHRISLLKQYCDPSMRSVVLSDVLPLDGAYNCFGYRSIPRSLKLQSLFGPGAGWVLCRPSPQNLNLASLNELRDWGYCFWERNRLQAWGAYQMENERDESSHELNSDSPTEMSARTPSDHSYFRATASATTDSPICDSFQKPEHDLGEKLHLWRRL